MKRLIVLALPFATLLGSPAQARIICNESYQVVGGREIATPYCADNYLAQVARSYGVRVSDSAVRNNPGRKGEICRMIGHDIRVQDACAGDSSRGRRF